MGSFLLTGWNEWTRESASETPARSHVVDTDPHLIRKVNLFAWVYKQVLKCPKNQAFWHIENEIDVNKKYTPDIS